MNNKRILSGYEIVAKGATKIEASLPELGIKDVFPNKTWLEDKQVQAAVEARKHLIEVERIDKSGVLNHAEWKEDLMLAEVTQNVGSYWQYLGQMMNKKLYLKPEEALFLLEINSLCLKHNDMKVSIQQAYNLLLRDEITLLQYKVYASLSRVGYRVYRYSPPEQSTCKHTKNNNGGLANDSKVTESEEVHINLSENVNSEGNFVQMTDSCNSAEVLQDCFIIKEEINGSSSNNLDTMQDNNTKCNNQMKPKKMCCLKQMQKLENRQLKPCNVEVLHKFFDNVPELLGNIIVNIVSPNKKLLPCKITLVKTFYRVDLGLVRNQKRYIRSTSTESNSYSVNDEVNSSNIRRLRSTSNLTESNLIPHNAGFPQNTQYRPSQWRSQQQPHPQFLNYNFNYMRPRPPFIYNNFNTLFQRPFLPNWYFANNFNFYPRAQPFFYRPQLNDTRNLYNSKRLRKQAKQQHLDRILKLAARLKQLILNGNNEQENINAIQRLIQAYNIRYKTKIRLDNEFEIIFDETIVDTIALDDDDEGPSSKRRKPDLDFEDSLNDLKMFALRLKVLEYKNNSSKKHRRVFSKVLKAFNDSYKEDYYLNEDYEISHRNQIDLDSTGSDLDCVIEETPTASSKVLKNPFNILKRLSQLINPQVLDLTVYKKTVTVKIQEYSAVTLNTFPKDWLPSEDDFGRVEIISKDDCSNEVTDVRREEFLYDFIKLQTCQHDNWLNLKKSFYNSIQATIVEFQDNIQSEGRMKINSIVRPQNCSDVENVLKKLSIIKYDKSLKDECNLSIDFDVYNRNVQNFRKSNRPTPHFRIICLDESTTLPSGGEIAALHSKYDDQVAIVFAIVGLDSISYIQMNPVELPMYISGNT